MQDIQGYIPEGLREEELFKHITTVFKEYTLHLFNTGYLDIDTKSKGLFVACWKPTTAYKSGDRIQFIPDYWAASIPTRAGQFIQPLIDNGHYYRSIQSGLGNVLGLTGTTEPSWPTTVGTTILDGEVTWECAVNYGLYFRCLVAGISGSSYPRFESITADATMLQDNAIEWLSETITLKDVVVENYTEFGYKYIIDMFTLNEKELQTLDAYLHLIHYLKGSKAGLELILNILDITYRIGEWWEEPGELSPWQFELYINLNQVSISPDSITKIRAFVRNYVYPELVLILEYGSLDQVYTVMGSINDRVIGGTIQIAAGGYGFDYGNNYGLINFSAWQSLTSYVIGAQIRPIVANGFYYQANNAGVSGNSEPSWPTIINNTIVDGAITWVCKNQVT